MAWGDPTSLKFDVSEISKMRTQIQNTSKDLASFKTTLLQEVENLKKQLENSSWKEIH